MDFSNKLAHASMDSVFLLKTPLGDVLRPEFDDRGAVLEVGSELLFMTRLLLRVMARGGPRTLCSPGPAVLDGCARPAGAFFGGIADTSELRAIGMLFLRPFVDMLADTPMERPSSCTSSCTATPGELASLRTSLRDWPLGGVLFGGIMDTSVLRAKGMFCTWASQER
jgi:hypothetical protein